MVLVAIQSVQFPNHYVRLDGQGVTSFTGSGGGTVNTQTFIGTYETYTLVVNDDGTVSFKSTVFDNVFLRLDATGVTAGQKLGAGGGTVNAQYTARSLERFKIHKKDDPAGKYCAISINSTGPVTRDSPAEILVSARPQNGRDSMFFSAHREDFCGIYVEIVLLS